GRWRRTAAMFASPGAFWVEAAGLVSPPGNLARVPVAEDLAAPGDHPAVLVDRQRDRSARQIDRRDGAADRAGVDDVAVEGPDAAHEDAGVCRDRSHIGDPARERRDADPARQRDADAGTGDRAAAAHPARALRHVVDADAQA